MTKNTNTPPSLPSPDNNTGGATTTGAARRLSTIFPRLATRTSFTMHDGRRRRGGSSSRNRSLVPTTLRGGAGGEDATCGHIDDRIILVGGDVHRVIVVVIIVLVQVLVGCPLLHLPDGKQPHPRHHRPPSNHRPPIPPPLPVVHRFQQPTPPQNQWYFQAVPF